MSIHEYADIEQHIDEILTVTHLSEIKKLCTLLELDILELLDINCFFCGQNADAMKFTEFTLPRNQLVKTRRELLGFTKDQLANRIGFEPAALNEIEHEPDFLESWSIELIEMLAHVIDVPVQTLMAAKCHTCGR